MLASPWLNVIDFGFCVYGATTILEQTGLAPGGDDATAPAAMSGLECSMTLNIGREPGTPICRRVEDAGVPAPVDGWQAEACEKVEGSRVVAHG